MAAGPSDAARKSQCNRVGGRDNDSRDRLRCGLGGQDAGHRTRHQHVWLEPNQFLRQRDHAFGRAVGIAKRQRHTASFQIPEIAQAGSKPRNVARRRCGGEGRENADQWVDHLLLPARCKRPRRRAAHQPDEIATLQLSKLHPQPTSQE